MQRLTQNREKRPTDTGRIEDTIHTDDSSATSDMVGLPSRVAGANSSNFSSTATRDRIVEELRRTNALLAAADGEGL